jgi:outer membrane protein OmpA-like peptidoglycan-associated protein
MKSSHVTPSLLVIAALLGACSSTPRSASLPDQSRSDYATAQNNPRVAAEAEAAGQQREQMRTDQRTQEADQARTNAEESRLAARMAESDADEAQRQTLRARGNEAEAQRQMQAAQARTAVLEARLADLSARKTPRGMVITLGDVLFGTDLARLNADGIARTQQLAAVLQQNPQRTVLIEGFTDSTGSAAHNQDLSERRAEAVRSALQDMGVAADRIVTRGYGETHPVAANDTEENRRLNRRVEIVFSNDNGRVAQR